MSLDLYLTSKKKVAKEGTGVYVRRNGQTEELKTVEEVKEYFPDADLSDIEERMYETNDIWHENITHNLNIMAEHVVVGGYNLYNLLWRPEESGFAHPTEEYRGLVYDGLIYMLKHKKELTQYNPDNGWGSYDSLLRFVESYVGALADIENADEIEIYASR